MQNSELFLDALFNWLEKELKQHPELRPLQIATIASKITNFAESIMLSEIKQSQDT